MSMLLPEGSLAKTSAQRGGKKVSRPSAADYGQTSAVLLARFDPDTQSWRTYQTCLVALANNEADGLARFSETWPRSGMTQSGIAYKLPTLAHRISGTGYGSSPTHSIPTPTAQDHIERRSTSTEVLNPETNKSVSL